MTQQRILPGATIGMLGGGQLGRMFTQAAKAMGYTVIVLEPGTDSPAGQVADEQLVAAYDDTQALSTLAERCDVITTEFENIPADVLRELSQSCPVHPSAEALEKTQDRIVEKEFIRSCGLLPVPYGEITTSSDIAIAAEKMQFPGILKTARFGYDGKGQMPVNSVEEVHQAYRELGHVDCVLEERVDLDCEVSVVLARNTQGETTCFPVSANIHKDGILFQSLVPARADVDIVRAAKVAAGRIAENLGFVGVLAVEFFVTRQGALLVNEIAPRTHNSGHYSIDACVTSQFEQQVRAVCNLPFGDSEQLRPIVMTNLLGDVWDEQTPPDWSAVLANPLGRLHLYGKHEARVGRKMGHFCLLGENDDISIDELEHQAQTLFSSLAG